MGRRKGRKRLVRPEGSAQIADAVRPEVKDQALPTTIDIMRRITAQFLVAIASDVLGAALTLAGIVMAMRSGGRTGLITALVGLLFLWFARFLWRGGGRRWVFRGLMPQPFAEGPDQALSKVLSALMSSGRRSLARMLRTSA